MKPGDLPLVIIAAFWAGFSAVITAYKTINDKRDQILHGHHEGNNLSMEHRRLAFFNDWIPMKFGIGLSSLVFGIAIVYIPNLMEKPEYKEQAIPICWVVALIPFLSCLGFCGLGISDLIFVKQTLDREKAKELDPTGEHPAVATLPHWGRFPVLAQAFWTHVSNLPKLERRLGWLFLLTSIGTLVYWLTYAIFGGVQVISADWYHIFERSFPVADTWMAVCAAAAGLGLLSNKPYGWRFGLLAGSAMVFLALMDITFNVQNGLYALATSSIQVVIEIVINAWTLALGAVSIVLAWKRC
jgi:hypothetical protein